MIRANSRFVSQFGLFGFLAAVLLASIGELRGQETRRPNIVVIMADDVGFSDVGCYGGEIRTPALDSLAQEGLRFTQFYNSARCCPTRASLLTGLYPHQAGMGHQTDNKSQLAGYAGDLRRDCPTIAELLRPAGYATYLCGKWHVTNPEDDAAQPHGNYPLQRGFDQFYGTIFGAGNFFDPATLCRGNRLITPQNDPDYRPERYYYTDAIADNAVRYLANHQQKSADNPFFLYVAFTAGHFPMQALPEDIARYRGQYDAGYQPIRAARWERIKQLGLVNSQCQLSPPARDWDSVKDKAWESACMEVYAAMIDRMDQGIGRIVAELRRQQVFDNTLILYLQDNGASAEEVGWQSNAAEIATHSYQPLGPNDLQTRALPPMQTRDGRPVRTGRGVMPGATDTYVAYGAGWANVSDTPFRQFKHWVHEGGISTPLIACWPAGIAPARRNQLVTDPGHIIDIAATCVDLAGATGAAPVAGRTGPTLAGISLRPALAGQRLARTEPIFFEHEGNRAVRDGRWKLVAGGPAGKWELYDMDADRSETSDLAASDPDRVRAMAGQWEAWARRVGAIPWIWEPQYGAAANAR